MSVHVLGLSVHPPAEEIGGKRLEEIVYDVTRAALDNAGLARSEIEQVVIAACDELDGRSISSMLLAAPAGAYLKDEIKCTDSGLNAIGLAAMRIEAGFGGAALVVSWNKNSTAPFDNVMSMRADPFFVRPVGLNSAVADGLFAAAHVAEGISEDEAGDWVLRYAARAGENPRRLRRALPDAAAISASRYLSWPLRAAHCAPRSDGAVAFVLASEDWMARRHVKRKPLARVAGCGWRTDSYQLNRDRLLKLEAFRGAFGDALRRAGRSMADIDAVELDSQTGYHAAAYARALEGLSVDPVPNSGGPFAQNPYFCTGMVHAAEAVLQVAGKAKGTQVADAKIAVAHGAHGFAQQGHVAVVFEGN